MTRYYAPEFKVTVNGTKLKSDISGNIYQIVVTKGIDSVQDTCKLSITNAAPEMRWTHTDDARLFWIGGEMQVDLGYVDNLTRSMMTGTITGVNASFPASGVPTITVTCTGYAQRLNQCKKTKTYTKKTDKQIAEQIGQDVGLEVQADETDIVYDHVIQPNQTDYQFLMARADILHYELFVDDKTLHFRKAQDDSEPTYTFVWSPAKSFTVGSRTLPLKSFTPDANALNQQYTETCIRAYDPKTKAATVNKSSNDEDAPNGVEPGSAARKKITGPCQQTDVTKPVGSLGEGQQAADAKKKKSAQQYVGGAAQTIGVPDLGPGVVVFLDGLGVFRGNYYVTQVVHTIGGNGYTTNFTVRRNATNAK
jgi:Bacteriophage probable baseplate hub protein